MRGDDQPSRYPPRGVWFGLILALCSVRALAAQEAPDDATRQSADPLVLSAERVWRWRGADGQYLYLSGAASVLQGTDGLRAACHLPDRHDLRGWRIPPPGRGVCRGRGPGHLAWSRPSRTGPRALPRARSPHEGLSARRRQHTEIRASRAGYPATLGLHHPTPGRRTSRARAARQSVVQVQPEPPPLEPALAPRTMPKVDTMLVTAQMTRQNPPGPDVEPDDAGPGPPGLVVPPPRTAASQPPQGGGAQAPQGAGAGSPGCGAQAPQGGGANPLGRRRGGAGGGPAPDRRPTGCRRAGPSG